MVQVLGGFSVSGRCGPITLPESTWRLIVLLALAQQPMARDRIAGILWGDKDEEHAQSSLRSTLWRLNQVALGLVKADGHLLQLAMSVKVDLAELQRLSTQLDADNAIDPSAVDPRLCCADLLPDWYDGFVNDQRELIRQLRLRTLEALARRLCEQNNWSTALRIALIAVSQAPLRETTHQIILEIHIAEGNVSEALRHYRLLKNTMWQELGIQPCAHLRSTIAPHVRSDHMLVREGPGRGHTAIG
jgi:DNA-binding SARP family transcriptional activator